jgi:hypothetical protein
MMIQFNAQRSIIYSDDAIISNMESNGSSSQGPSERSSRPKNSIQNNKRKLTQRNGEEVIGIGFPVDEAEFKELKSKSRLKMNSDSEGDTCQSDRSEENENQ